MNIDNLIEEFLAEKHAGMDYSEMRQLLKNRGADEDQVRSIIRSVDDQFLRGQEKSGTETQMSMVFITGLILFIASVVLSAGSYFQWIDLNGFYILAYGPACTGLSMMTFSRVRARSRSTGNYFGRMKRNK
ncbi:MAG: hypothetical protein QNK23_11810 [Crocinitomicaceae bacterium]|nr:hypothetical protein [Crocinitomicaceae bacterium]